MAVLRKSTDVYLIGPMKRELLGGKLPSNRDVLSYFHYLLSTEKDVKVSAKIVIDKCFEFYNKARIPTRAHQHCITKFLKLYERWKKLKSHSSRQTVREIANRINFSESLDLLFDISHRDALKLITIEEDREFLILQRQPNRSGHMIGIDRTLATKEKKKREKKEKEEDRKQKHYDEIESSSKFSFCHNNG